MKHLDFKKAVNRMCLDREDERDRVRVIYKFPLQVGENLVEIPKGYAVKYFGSQETNLFIWATLDPEGRKISARFVVLGTGQPIPDGVYHVASTQVGPFVWHLFEEVD